MTETSITVGTLLPATGPLAETGRAIGAVLAAYFAEINEQGGVHDRRLQIKTAEPAETAPGTAAGVERLLIPAWDAVPEPDAQRPASDDDVLLLRAVAVSRRLLARCGEHQLFAIFRFLGEVHQDETLFTKAAQAEIGHIPARFGGKGPTRLDKRVTGRSDRLVDLGSPHMHLFQE